MKRSKSIGLSLMGTVPFLLTACDQAAPPAAQGLQLPAYGSVDECVQAGIFTRQACEDGMQAAQQAHLAEAPRFDSAADCERQYGAANCQLVQTGSDSWFMPAMAGFMMGQALANNRGYYGGMYRGEPLYRDRHGRGGWRTADNRPVAQPDKAISRSRGGFGSQAAARGSWGS